MMSVRRSRWAALAVFFIGLGAGRRFRADALDPRGRHQARTGRYGRRTSARGVNRRGDRADPAGAVGILAATRPDRDGAARQPSGLRLRFAALAAAICRRELCDPGAQSSRSCHQHTDDRRTRAAALQRWIDAPRSPGGDIGARRGYGDPGTARQELGFRAAQTFVRVLQLEATLRATDAAVAAAESDRQRARARRDVGLVTQADVLAVDVHLADM